MLRLGARVYIVGDSLEQSLPIGEYAYVIAYERNADNVFDYLIRIPKTNKHQFVMAADIELAEVLLEQEASRIEREALIDYALATRNEELFKRIINGGAEETADTDAGKQVQSTQDFVKQINLRAWI